MREGWEVTARNIVDKRIRSLFIGFAGLPVEKLTEEDTEIFEALAKHSAIQDRLTEVE